jgi:hypothetical protein
VSRIGIALLAGPEYLTGHAIAGISVYSLSSPVSS